MATSATKKPAARATKKAPAKKAPVKKAATAKATHNKTVVRRTTKAATSADMRSFRASRPAEPFFTFRITHQTFYWLVLAIIVVGLGVWVLSISIKVQHIYDQIDATNSQTFNLPDIKATHKAN